MIKEIVLVSNAFVNGFPAWISFLISVINALIPFGFSLYQDLCYGDHEFNVKKYKNVGFWIYNASLFYLNYRIFEINYTFVKVALVDIKRRLFQMKCLYAMLETNRFKLEDEFLMMPTINYFDPQTMLSWLDHRNMIDDIGMRFKIRMEFFINIYFITYGIMLAYFLCWFFGGGTIELPA